MPLPLPAQLAPGTVVAHRGDRTAQRENTVAAFVAAAAAGAAAVELDVRRTADDGLVIHHDAVVEGIGAVVEQSLSELRRRAPWIPTLPEALAACNGMWVNIEIKNSPTDPDWDPQRAVAATLAAGIDAAGALVSSFDWGSIETARSSGLATAWLVQSAPLSAIERASVAGHRAVNPRASLLEGPVATEVVAAANRAGMWVMPWTVNDETEAIRLRDAGVHAIITDDPARLVAALG
jgi:glycerophosphoryl diester phosphodiesterase